MYIYVYMYKCIYVYVYICMLAPQDLPFRLASKWLRNMLFCCLSLVLLVVHLKSKLNIHTYDIYVTYT